VLFIHPGAYPSRFEEMEESAEIASARGLRDSEAIVSYYFKMPVLMLMLITVRWAGDNNTGGTFAAARARALPKRRRISRRRLCAHPHSPRHLPPPTKKKTPAPQPKKKKNLS